MDIFPRSGEKRRLIHDFRRQEEEVIGSLCRLGSRPISPKTQLEQEKRIRREIANSNERRRMQSINAGFQSLRSLLPHHEGEKLSKAAILQHTADYIYQLEQEKTRLLSQNCQLKRLLNSQMSMDSDGSADSPLPKRKKAESTEYVDEGLGNMSPKESIASNPEDLKREMVELRLQLERERKLRMVLEEQSHSTPDTQNSSEESPSDDNRICSPPYPAIKAEPLSPSPTDMPQDLSAPKEGVEDKPPSRCLYHASTSRQNLETIVEAIRHLEGDHLFSDLPKRDRPPSDSEENASAANCPKLSKALLMGSSDFRHKVIKCSPLSQLRPGVIVTNHS